MTRQEIEKRLWKWMCLGLIAPLILVFGLLTSDPAHGRAGAIEVSGSLSEDITWTKADSPYVVTGDTTVSEGVTLVIEQQEITVATLSSQQVLDVSDSFAVTYWFDEIHAFGCAE